MFCDKDSIVNLNLLITRSLKVASERFVSKETVLQRRWRSETAKINKQVDTCQISTVNRQRCRWGFEREPFTIRFDEG